MKMSDSNKKIIIYYYLISLSQKKGNTLSKGKLQSND